MSTLPARRATRRHTARPSAAAASDNAGNQMTLLMPSRDIQDRPSTTTVATAVIAAAPTPPMRMLRVRQVCQVTGLGRSTIYLMESEGRFPRRVQLGLRAVAWIESDVQAWLQARAARQVHRSPISRP